MPRLVCLDSALRDLAAIGADIEDFTGDCGTAMSPVERSTRHRSRRAARPGLPGRRRPELRADCRGIASGSYLIFFRYLDEGEPRAVVEVIHLLHGARDLKSSSRRRYSDP